MLTFLQEGQGLGEGGQSDACAWPFQAWDSAQHHAAVETELTDLELKK